MPVEPPNVLLGVSMRYFKKTDWSISLSLLFACVVTVIGACVESSGPLGAPNVIEGGTVASVQITLARSALAPGQTTQATAVAKAADGEVVPGLVNFSSQDPAIATVSSNGVVTAVSVGLALIQASVSCCSATAPVTVNSLGSPVAVVVVALDSTSLAIGHSARASATARDSAGNIMTGEVATWVSLSPNVATVSPTGTVTGVATGSATIQGTVFGRMGSASIAVVQVPGTPAAAVAVAIDSTTLLVGHVAQAVAMATDASGNRIPAPTVTWSSLAPSVATVSSSGAVTAVAEGSAVIRATVSGVAGTDSLLVVVPPDLASQNFDGGSYSPYDNLFGSDVDVVNDPTNSGRGMVARMHYVRVTSLDKNIFLQYSHNIGFDSTIYSRGDFYVDVSDLGAGGWPGNPQSMARKLLYYRPYQPVTKYGGCYRDFLMVVGLAGDGTLGVDTKYTKNDNTRVDRMATIATGLTGKRWYTLETQVKMETALGAGDGIFRVWLDGVQIYSITNMTLSDPAWANVPIPDGYAGMGGCNSTPWDPADYFLAYMYVGEQVNLSGYTAGTFDEYRYWDNVSFSHTRIGH